MKTKTEVHYYCEFCHTEFTSPHYITIEHEPKCLCNPKNNPCKTCGGFCEITIINPLYEFDNGEHPFIKVKCLECDGTGKNTESNVKTITNPKEKKTNCFECEFLTIDSLKIHECSLIKKFIDKHKANKMHCEVFHKGTPKKEEEYED